MQGRNLCVPHLLFCIMVQAQHNAFESFTNILKRGVYVVRGDSEGNSGRGLYMYEV
jgi:hypothetical protein